MISKVARRYAKAVFDSVESPQQAAVVAEELLAFGRVLDESQEAQIVLVHGMVPVEKRKRIVDDLAGRLKVKDKTRKVLDILIDAKRLGEVSAIAERLQELISQKTGILLMDVKSAYPLASDMREKVEKKFETVLKSKVQARYVVDSSILGGLHVTAGGRTFDGSVSGMLSELQEQMF